MDLPPITGGQPVPKRRHPSARPTRYVHLGIMVRPAERDQFKADLAIAGLTPAAWWLSQWNELRRRLDLPAYERSKPASE